MALDRLDFGTVPNPVVGDWALLSAIVSKAFQNTYNPIQFVSTNVPQGATFQIGGVIYYGSTDTVITGTPSNYVKLTPNVGDSGATCDAAFVANLTGVTWSKIYNGYYDVSGNLHIFDEVTAILAGHLSGSNTKFSQLFNAHLGQNLKPTDAVTFATVNTGQGANELYDMNQDVKTSDSVTFAVVVATTVVMTNASVAASLIVNGSLLPTVASTLGSWSLTTTPMLIPRGIYSILNTNHAGGYSIIQMQTSSASWYTISNGLEDDGELIFSDGTNFRIYVSNLDTTVYYRKF